MSRLKTRDNRRETELSYLRAFALSRFLFILGALLLFNACKTTQESQRRIALQAAEKGERINTIVDYGLRYNSLSASLSVRLTANGKSNSADGQLRIKNGECIQLSVRMPLIGSELFRMQITPGQIVLIDRYNKQYAVESIYGLKDDYPFDFDYNDLEALFTNRLFMAGNQNIPANHSKFYLVEDEYNTLLNYTDDQYIDYLFRSDYTHRIQETFLTKGSAKMQWLYSDFKPASNRQLFPMKEEITVSGGGIELQLSLTFKTVDVDSDFTIDYNLPTKYTKISLEEFMKNL